MATFNTNYLQGRNTPHTDQPATGITYSTLENTEHAPSQGATELIAKAFFQEVFTDTSNTSESSGDEEINEMMRGAAGEVIEELYKLQNTFSNQSFQDDLLHLFGEKLGIFDAISEAPLLVGSCQNFLLENPTSQPLDIALSDLDNSPYAKLS